MTPVALPHPIISVTLPTWFWPLLRRLAGRPVAAWPERLEDWQLRDLNLTRPFPGPCHPSHIWLP